MIRHCDIYAMAWISTILIMSDYCCSFFLSRSLWNRISWRRIPRLWGCQVAVLRQSRVGKALLHLLRCRISPTQPLVLLCERPTETEEWNYGFMIVSVCMVANSNENSWVKDQVIQQGVVTISLQSYSKVCWKFIPNIILQTSNKLTGGRSQEGTGW